MALETAQKQLGSSLRTIHAGRSTCYTAFHPPCPTNRIPVSPRCSTTFNRKRDHTCAWIPRSDGAAERTRLGLARLPFSPVPTFSSDLLVSHSDGSTEVNDHRSLQSSRLHCLFDRLHVGTTCRCDSADTRTQQVQLLWPTRHVCSILCRLIEVFDISSGTELDPTSTINMLASVRRAPDTSLSSVQICGSLVAVGVHQEQFSGVLLLNMPSRNAMIVRIPEVRL